MSSLLNGKSYLRVLGSREEAPVFDLAVASEIACMLTRRWVDAREALLWQYVMFPVKEVVLDAVKKIKESYLKPVEGVGRWGPYKVVPKLVRVVDGIPDVEGSFILDASPIWECRVFQEGDKGILGLRLSVSGKLQLWGWLCGSSESFSSERLLVPSPPEIFRILTPGEVVRSMQDVGIMVWDPVKIVGLLREYLLPYDIARMKALGFGGG